MLTRRKISLFRLARRPALDANASLMAPRRRSTGGRCERLNLSPAGISRPGIELTAADAAVEAGFERGMQMIGLLGGMPCRFDSEALPPHPEGEVFHPVEANAYMRYVEHLVDRYGDAIEWWESWHRPNTGAGWGTTPDAVEYAELLYEQYLAVKRGNFEARLALAPMENTDLAYMRCVLDHLDGERCFDAIAVHPYRWRPGSEAVRDVRLEDGVSVCSMTWKEELRSVATMVERLGYGTPDFWITETDWYRDEDPELKARSMLAVGQPTHAERVTRDAHHVEDSFASLRDDPDLDFVKTGLWFDMNEQKAAQPLVPTRHPALGCDQNAPPRRARFGSYLVSGGD